MPDYSVFGSCLHSELEFPELKSVSDTLPKWNLTLGEPRNPASDSHPLGQYEITESISVRLYQSNSGFEVRFDDTGSFHV
ncbi:MAG: hypothetical protein MK136_17595, partial [Pirellulaceae bacterium]|nr:hypothetical protein [Pirellulaceae bacterium]